MCVISPSYVYARRRRARATSPKRAHTSRTTPSLADLPVCATSATRAATQHTPRTVLQTTSYNAPQSPLTPLPIAAHAERPKRSTGHARPANVSSAYSTQFQSFARCDERTPSTSAAPRRTPTNAQHLTHPTEHEHAERRDERTRSPSDARRAHEHTSTSPHDEHLTHPTETIATNTPSTSAALRPTRRTR